MSLEGNLVLLTLPYLDFAGEPKLGRMIVAREVAPAVTAIFEEIFEGKSLRIERMELIDNYGGDDGRSMAANNTSAFNCRAVTGGSRLSGHARGIAIDINPVQNPWTSQARTEPNEGVAFDNPAERVAGVTGIILPGSAVIEAFKKRGWKWGGDWKNLKDYQHFSEDGR